MNDVMWSWTAKERLNLSEAPCDDWAAVYHWLSDSVDDEVVVKIDDSLDVYAYIVEVQE